MGWYERLISRNVPNISPAEAYKRLQANADVIIVDVRQPMETASGTIPGAVVIPLTEFGRRMDELPRDRPILTICRSSHRSPIAARQLRSAGYDVTNVSGGDDCLAAGGPAHDRRRPRGGVEQRKPAGRCCGGIADGKKTSPCR